MVSADKMCLRKMDVTWTEPNSPLPGRAVQVTDDEVSFPDTETGALRVLQKGALGTVASVDADGSVVAAFPFTGGGVRQKIGRRLSMRDEDRIGDVRIAAPGSDVPEGWWPGIEFGGVCGSDATRWSSRADPTAGSYDATFVLPHGATEVQVRFDVVGGRKVQAWDRREQAWREVPFRFCFPTLRCLVWDFL